ECNCVLESPGLSFPMSMRAAIAVLVVAAVLGSAAPHARALSLGPVSHAGRLGQPLDFAVAVKLDPDDSVAPTCIAAEVTAGDNHVPPQQVRARLVRSGRAGEAEARVFTTVKLNDAVVSVTLSLGCPPK